MFVKPSKTMQLVPSHSFFAFPYSQRIPIGSFIALAMITMLQVMPDALRKLLALSTCLKAIFHRIMRYATVFTNNCPRLISFLILLFYLATKMKLLTFPNMTLANFHVFFMLVFDILVSGPTSLPKLPPYPPRILVPGIKNPKSPA